MDATYFITEESQTSQEQLMIAALSSSGTPKLLFNIPLLSRTSPVGITWDPRTGNIFFISPPDLCKVDGATGKLTKTPLGAPPGASYPTKANYGILFFIQGGSLFGLPSGKGKAPTLVTRTSTYAFSPTNTLAFIQADNPHKVNVSGRTYTLQWAEPWFYHGHVTSLGFSPDGAYLGYTVTNPIVPEEGFYYLRLSDGKCFRLPFSTSRAGWDWAR